MIAQIVVLVRVTSEQYADQEDREQAKIHQQQRPEPDPPPYPGPLAPSKLDSSIPPPVPTAHRIQQIGTPA